MISKADVLSESCTVVAMNADLAEEDSFLSRNIETSLYPVDVYTRRKF